MGKWRAFPRARGRALLVMFAARPVHATVAQRCDAGISSCGGQSFTEMSLVVEGKQGPRHTSVACLKRSGCESSD
ncbi:hypothetical protein EDB81DRAFT_769510, partial [Dactylonectria macrodidyma]